MTGDATPDDLGQTLALLASAAEHKSLVRIRRRIRNADTLEGFVVGFGPAWTLLARLADTIALDGYIAIRTPDVSSVAIRVGAEPFAVRALRSAGDWPPVPPVAVTFGSLREVLDSAAAHAPLVTIGLEAEDPDAAYVGRVARLDDLAVELLQISPEAEWDSEPEAFEVAEISRVDFGARYEAALYRVGGEPPAMR